MTMRAELQRVGSDGQSAPFADDDSAGQRWPRRRGCSGAIGQGLRLAAFWRPGRGIRRRGWRRPSADSARERRRWLLAGGAPLSPRNAWALIGLASGDQPFSECCPGLLERAEELSRTRARLTRGETWSSWLRLRRRATLIVRQLPESLRGTLEHKAALVRTGASAATAYGWDELRDSDRPNWRLDAYFHRRRCPTCRTSSVSWTLTARLTRRRRN